MSLDLDAVEKLCAEATEGPWEAYPYTYDGRQVIGPCCDIAFADATDFKPKQAQANAAFIAAAREALPALVARVRELEALKLEIGEGDLGAIYRWRASVNECDQRRIRALETALVAAEQELADGDWPSAHQTIRALLASCGLLAALQEKQP